MREQGRQRVAPGGRVATSADVSAPPASAVDSPPTTPRDVEEHLRMLLHAIAHRVPVPGPSRAVRTAAEPIAPHQDHLPGGDLLVVVAPGPSETTPSHRPPTTHEPTARTSRGRRCAPARRHRADPRRRTRSPAARRGEPGRSPPPGRERRGHTRGDRAHRRQPRPSRSAARANCVAYRRGQSGPTPGSRGRAGVQYPPLTAPDPPRVRPRAARVPSRRGARGGGRHEPGPTSSGQRGDAACSPDSEQQHVRPGLGRAAGHHGPAGPAPTTTSALTA